MSTASRLKRLNKVQQDHNDTRLAWLRPGIRDTHGRELLAIYDHCVDWLQDAWQYDGIVNTPGFDRLPQWSRTQLSDLWALFGAARPRRFAQIIASMVDPEEQYRCESNFLPSRIAAVKMRRRMRSQIPLMFTRFERDGCPRMHYDNAGTPSHAPNWPESAQWNDEDRDWMQYRYFRWNRR